MYAREGSTHLTTSMVALYSLHHLYGATIYGVVEAGSSGPVPETQVRLVFHQRVYHLQVLVTLQGQELETPDVMVKSLYFLQI